MSADQAMHAAMLERLSALVDGELDDTATAAACGHWREDAALRASWHEYHLIGDLLRSDDLASTGARDAAFLGALRVRLASEPVVLAPQPVQFADAHAKESVASQVVNGTRAGRRWSWMAPGAVAAGFVAVAGVLMVTRGPATVAPSVAPVSASIAQVAPVVATTESQPPLATVAADASPSATIEPQATIANGKLIRDARLDRYLSAHQQFAGRSALGVPSAFLRNATAEVPSR